MTAALVTGASSAIGCVCDRSREVVRPASSFKTRRVRAVTIPSLHASAPDPVRIDLAVSSARRGGCHTIRHVAGERTRRPGDHVPLHGRVTLRTDEEGTHRDGPAFPAAA